MGVDDSRYHARLPLISRRLRIAWLPDGKRLNLRDGPIDLVVQAFGRAGDIARAYDAAIARMRVLLDELYEEIGALRSSEPVRVRGAAARRMAEAVAPFQAAQFMTPLAAVAGGVADEVLAAMLGAAALERAYVNNGGDIALHLGPGQSFTSAALERPGGPGLNSEFRITSSSQARGFATAGWTRRGFTLGVADSVTVAGRSAAAADAAASYIGNATDLAGHAAVTRVPASTLQPGSDLNDIAVTTHVGRLSLEEKRRALKAGRDAAEQCLAAGWIAGANIMVQGESVRVFPGMEERK